MRPCSKASNDVPDLVGLTSQQRADFYREEVKARNDVLAHAISLLNNHMSRFGTKAWVPPADNETWKGDGDPPYELAAVPPEVLGPLTEAMVYASKLAAKRFREECES